MIRTAVTETEEALRRIEAVDPQLRCMLETHADAAKTRAADLDKRQADGESAGPLQGVPIAIKDNICTRVGKTTCGSKILEDFAAPYEAHVVERLLADGAVIVGKTNMDEFAMGSSTENSGFFPTRNPWNTDHVPGGSSGGSVAAVAARMVPYALGSETGGSIRQPASFCGVSGLKPTYGRVSRYGLVAYGSSLDQIAPTAVDARGLALILRSIAGHDPRDSTSVSEPVQDYVAMLDEPLGKLRIGIADEYLGEGLHPDTRKAVEAAIEVYRGLGAEVATIHLPHAKYTVATYYIVAVAECSSNLARFDGVHYGHRTAAPADYIDMYAASRAEGFGQEVKRRIMLGTYVLSSGYYDAYYLKALKVRTLIKNDFIEAFKRCDVILSPTTPTPAFRFGEKVDNPLEMYLADIYNGAANLAGIPAVSIPCGLSAAEMPIGLQLMAPHFAEGRLLQVADAFQRATEFHEQLPGIHAA